MERCIDISNYQGVVSVQTFLNMRASGIPNVIIRCSYTQGAKFVQRVDASFAQNIINAYKANLRIGVYHFSQAISETEAIKEAEFTLKTIEPYKKYIHLPVAFDWEFYKRLNSSVARKMGKQRCKQICDAYCRTVRSGGYEPMVYANLSTLNGYIADELYKKWKYGLPNIIQNVIINMRNICGSILPKEVCLESVATSTWITSIRMSRSQSHSRTTASFQSYQEEDGSHPAILERT